VGPMTTRGRTVAKVTLRAGCMRELECNHVQRHWAHERNIKKITKNMNGMMKNERSARTGCCNERRATADLAWALSRIGQLRGRDGTHMSSNSGKKGTHAVMKDFGNSSPARPIEVVYLDCPFWQKVKKIWLSGTLAWLGLDLTSITIRYCMGRG
jgi:hypothetical protein